MKFYEVFTKNGYYIFGAESFMEAVDLVKTQIKWESVTQIRESQIKAVILKEGVKEEDGV